VREEKLLKAKRKIEGKGIDKGKEEKWGEKRLMMKKRKSEEKEICKSKDESEAKGIDKGE
jgi:hypothetical protein